MGVIQFLLREGGRRQRESEARYGGPQDLL